MRGFVSMWWVAAISLVACGGVQTGHGRDTERSSTGDATHDGYADQLRDVQRESARLSAEDEAMRAKLVRGLSRMLRDFTDAETRLSDRFDTLHDRTEKLAEAIRRDLQHAGGGPSAGVIDEKSSDERAPVSKHSEPPKSTSKPADAAGHKSATDKSVTDKSTHAPSPSSASHPAPPPSPAPAPPPASSNGSKESDEVFSP